MNLLTFSFPNLWWINSFLHYQYQYHYQSNVYQEHISAICNSFNARYSIIYVCFVSFLKVKTVYVPILFCNKPFVALTHTRCCTRFKRTNHPEWRKPVPHFACKSHDISHPFLWLFELKWLQLKDSIIMIDKSNMSDAKLTGKLLNSGRCSWDFFLCHLRY